LSFLTRKLTWLLKTACEYILLISRGVTMKLSNLALKLAIATALSTAGMSAFAGTTTATNINIAADSFGAAFDDTTVTTPATNVLFTGAASTPIGGSFVTTFTLSGGAKFNAVPGLATTGTGGGTYTTVGSLNANGDVLTVLTNLTVAAGTVPVVTLTTPAFKNVKSALTTVGGKVNITVALTNYGGPGGTGIVLGTDSGTAVAALTSAAGITLTATASVDNKVIDVQNASSNGKKFTVGTVGAGAYLTNLLLLNLGNIAVADGTAFRPGGVGATAYNTATNATGAGALGLTVTVTPNGASWPTGSSLQLTNDANCTTGLSAAVNTVGTANVDLPLTLAAANGTSYFACLTVNGTADIPVFTPKISAVLKKSVATDADSAVSAINAYAIVSNGKTAFVDDVISTLNIPGYSSILRIINNGSIAAAPTLTVYDVAGAQVGTSFTAASMPANGGITHVTSANIAASIGGLPAGTYRVKVTAPTGGLRVQNFLVSPTGFSEISGAVVGQ
jgi:hypothetical protein